MELKRVRLTHRRVSRGRGCGRERGQAEGGGAGPGGGREAFWEGGAHESIKRRLDSLEATQGATRDPHRDSRGERSPWLPLETRPDSPGDREAAWPPVPVPAVPCNLSIHALEKAMATHSSVLAWRVPGTGEPAGLPSMGSHRVGHD